MIATTVRIVDDEPANLFPLTSLLRPRDLVRAVKSARNALRAMASEPRPDLMLLDAMMPRMEGRPISPKRRGNPVTRDIDLLARSAPLQERGKVDIPDHFPLETGLAGGGARNALCRSPRDHRRRVWQTLRSRHNRCLPCPFWRFHRHRRASSRRWIGRPGAAPP